MIDALRNELHCTLPKVESQLQINQRMRGRCFLISLAQSKRYHCPAVFGTAVVHLIIALSRRDSRVRPRIDRARTGTTVSHRALSILRHALQTIYGKSIPQRGGQTIMPCLSQENPAQPGRIIPSRKNPTSLAILLRGDKRSTVLPV